MSLMHVNIIDLDNVRITIETFVYKTISNILRRLF
jgi:hypothetical protein